MAQDFEFDARKSEHNKNKHGIDFVESQGLWDDPHAVESAARFEGERRRMLVASCRGKLWTAIHVRRNDVIRLISVRRARSQEVRRYESKRVR